MTNLVDCCWRPRRWARPADASARLVEALEQRRHRRRRGHPAGPHAGPGARRPARRQGRQLLRPERGDPGARPGRARSAPGATVLVVSDAGMPLISDPGYRLVAACVDAGLPVSCLPGPSAVTTALAVSGPAVGPVLLRGLRPAQARRPADVARRPGRRAAHLRVLRVAAAPGRHACATRPTRSVPTAPRGGVPGADQDPRGGHARARWASSPSGPADGVLGEITVVLAGAVPQADLATLVAEVERTGRRGDAGEGRVRRGDRRRILARRRGVSSTTRCLRSRRVSGRADDRRRLVQAFLPLARRGPSRR